MLVRDVPDPAHRTGLATCAHAHRTTEDLLAETVGERAPEVWAWLASRSFVRHSGTGLHLHDLMRDLVDTEFAQRNPQAYGALHRTIRAHATRRLRSGRTTTPFRDATELFLLPRHPPLAAEFRQLRDEGVLPVEPGRAADHAEVAALVTHDRGAREGTLAAGWLAAQPECLYVARSDVGIEGWALQVRVPDPAGPDDPVVAAALAAAERQSPLRPGETAKIARCVGARAGPRSAANMVLVGSVTSIIEWLTQAGRHGGWSPPPTSPSGGRSWSTSGSRSWATPGTPPSTAGTAGGCPSWTSCGSRRAASSPARPGRRRRRC